MSTSKYLKSKRHTIECIAVESLGAEILAKGFVDKPRHLIQGTGYGIVPPHWESSYVDGFISIGDDEVEKVRHNLAIKEGLFVGYSAAANVAASIRFLNSTANAKDCLVVTVLCDTGLKY